MGDLAVELSQLNLLTGVQPKSGDARRFWTFPETLVKRCDWKKMIWKSCPSIWKSLVGGGGGLKENVVFYVLILGEMIHFD